jgi:Tfp pilus assembly protein PilZ
MPAAKAGSLVPPGGSIPPEASLVEVSAEREQALAGALEAALPAPRAVQMDALEAAALAPPPAKLEALEVVRLDFGGPAPDPNIDLEHPDLELDLGYRSESNFYTDVLGGGLGLFIATFVVKPPGTPLVARLTLPEHPRPFVVSGTVQWVLEFKPSIEAPPGIGLLLRPVEGAPRKAIDEFMKVRLPILHDE